MPESVVGRLGRWCFRRWWWVLAVWVIAAAAGVAATGPLFATLADSAAPHTVESIAANDLLGAAANNGGTVVGLVHGADRTSDSVPAAVTASAARLAAIPGVTVVHQPFETGLPPAAARRLIGSDGTEFLVSVTLANGTRTARDQAINAVRTELHALEATLPPGASVRVGGNTVVNLDNRTMARADLTRAEYISLPLTLIVLVIVFGGLVVAGLPVLTAAVSVAAAMTVLLGFAQVTSVDQNGVTVVTLLGLGLSIDYGLLLVARYREELVSGWAPEVAIARAWATAGRTIMFSALTVAAALTGLLMFDLPTLTALGAAGVSIAVVSMLASLTLTAGLIGLLRRWVRPSRRDRRAAPAPSTASPSTASAEPGLGHSDADDRGFFAGLARLVQRRPILVVVATSAVLLAAGSPLLTASLRLPGAAAVPPSVESVQVTDALGARFGVKPAPAITVLAQTDPATLDRWAVRWTSDPAVATVRPAQPVAAPGTTPTMASVAIDVVGDTQSAAARELVLRIRADRPPAAQSWVTGDAATLYDLLGLIDDGLPAAIAVTLIAMTLLLFAMTGSLVVPIKAILANLISLGATFGVMTAVFGHGVASSLLDTLTVGALNPFVVVLVFAFAFGLSMDYEVFLLGRIKEQVDAGVETDTAVRRGLQHTGRVITSAALLMVIVFACFAAARTGSVEEIGLGLSVAVLVDATIVRCLLVPATMTLLGRWNWWAPAGLRRLHERSGLRERPLPQADKLAQVERSTSSQPTGGA